MALGGAAFGTVVQLSAAVSPSVVRLFAAMLLLMTVGAALCGGWCCHWHGDAALASVAFGGAALGGAALGGAALGRVLQLSVGV